jgi:hypothetical protein
MSKKKKSAKPAPVEIKFTFLLQPDGILAAYEGTDPRTHAVGQAVLIAIAAEYDWQITAV